MDKAYTVKGFGEARLKFAALQTPGDLAGLLGITQGALFHLAAYPRYTYFRKRTGRRKRRALFRPTPELKSVQKSLNYFLQAVYYPIRPASVHGFVKCPSDVPYKLSILSNAQCHTGKNYVVSADVFRFFPTISATMVRNVFLSAPFHFNVDLASALALLCVCRNWLPAGSPVSPVISNLVCIPLDQALERLAEGHGYTYTRYADDLTFSGNEPPGDMFRQQLEMILGQHGFLLNYKKYRVQSRHSRQMVTGLVVNEKVNLPRAYKKKLRAMVHNMEHSVTLQACTFLKKYWLGEIERQYFINMIEGRKRWVKQVEMFGNHHSP